MSAGAEDEDDEVTSVHAASPRTSAAAPARAPRRRREDIMDKCSFGSVEGFAAGAGVLGVGVVDREALALNRVGEVDRGTAQVGNAHAIDDDLDAVEGTNRIAIERAIVEVQLVDEAGAAAGLNGDAQAQVFWAFGLSMVKP